MYSEVLAQYEGIKTTPAVTRLHTQQPGPHPEHDSYDWWSTAKHHLDYFSVCTLCLSFHD